MDKAIMILIGLFLFSLFGDIVNDLFYYIGFIFRFLFDFLYYVLSNFIGLSNFGGLLISIMYYYFLIDVFRSITSYFTNN